VTLFLHRKVVFSTKLCLKKFGFLGLNETAKAGSAGGLNETAEADADSVVSMRVWKQIQWSQCDHGILCDTSEALVKTSINSFKGAI
jgi:hypothetical protein